MPPPPPPDEHVPTTPSQRTAKPPGLGRNGWEGEWGCNKSWEKLAQRDQLIDRRRHASHGRIVHLSRPPYSRNAPPRVRSHVLARPRQQTRASALAGQVPTMDRRNLRTETAAGERRCAFGSLLVADPANSTHEIEQPPAAGSHVFLTESRGAVQRPQNFRRSRMISRRRSQCVLRNTRVYVIFKSNFSLLVTW